MAVTIAIPFFNAELYLADAIRSVFAQTYKDWELILIDDGSTDRSLEIAKSVSDPRVTVVSDGKNKKLAARLNEVSALAKYEYIARMDADDLMSPNRLQVQLDVLSKKPQLDMVSVGTFSILNDNTLVGYRGGSFSGATFLELIKKEKSILHAGILARTEWYKRNRYDENLPLAQDTDMWLRASKRDDLKVEVISDLLYVYREEGNVTAKKMLRAYKLERDVFSLYIDSYACRIKYRLRSRAKSFVVFALSKFGCLDLLLARRNKRLNDGVRLKEYESIMESIASTKVPGMDF